MEGIYIKPTNCAACFNYTNDKINLSLCKSCLRESMHKVKILKVGVGEHGDKVVILLDNGMIKTINNYEISFVEE